VGNQLQEVRVIFSQQPKVSSRNHCGSRIVFDRSGQLLVGLGADAGVLDADRDRARDVAASHGHWGVVKELA
jgi:glucose/arabinose dehydrogenase